MSNFELIVQEYQNIPVISVVGYFNDKAGEELDQKSSSLIQSGKPCLILDFDRCLVINSLGISLLMAVALKYADECQGKLFFTGLDVFKQDVLKTAGILPLIQIAPDVPSALDAIQY